MQKTRGSEGSEEEEEEEEKKKNSRKKDQTDEVLRDVVLVSGLVDTADENVCAE